MTAFPKPVKRVKERKQLRRAAPIASKPKKSRRKRAVVVEAPAFPKPEHVEGTSYSRRVRHFGLMLFTKHRVCAAGALSSRPCVRDEDGLTQAAHLGDIGVRARSNKPDDMTCGSMCLVCHPDFDQSKGVFAGWPIDVKRAWAEVVVAENLAAWFALTPAERDAWDARAAAERRSPRAA